MTTLGWAAGVVVGVAALAMLSRTMRDEDGANGSRRYTPHFQRHVRALAQRAAAAGGRAQQDGDPLLALVDSTTALAHARSARRLVAPRDIERVAGVNIDELVWMLEAQQLEALKSVHRVCPELQPGGVFALGADWLG